MSPKSLMSVLVIASLFLPAVGRPQSRAGGKLKDLGARIAADYKAMATKYEVEFQTDSNGPKPIDVAVARAGVRLQMSYRRGSQL